MGCYSFDKDGFIFVNVGDGLFEYWVKIGMSFDIVIFLFDEDGIIFLLAEDYFLDDVAGCFCCFLEVVFGFEVFEVNLQFVEKVFGWDICSYFVWEFYKDYLQCYKKCFIYWFFSFFGKYFQAFVYVYCYCLDIVSCLFNDYVCDFICKFEVQCIIFVEIIFKADGSFCEQMQA